MSRLREVAEEWRLRVLAREDKATLEIARAYRAAIQSVGAELIGLLDSFGEGRSRLPIERLEAILPQLRQQFDRFAGDSASAILGAQADVAAFAAPAAREAVQAQSAGVLVAWDAVPSAATERAVGFLADG
ncbi:hypothetical protein EON81_02905, partial [bacterium]